MEHGCRWMGHLKLHNVDDGDNVFMHKMSANNWQRAQQKGGQVDWPRWQYSPSTSDRCPPDPPSALSPPGMTPTSPLMGASDPLCPRSRWQYSP